jgi:hypothetical protein
MVKLIAAVGLVGAVGTVRAAQGLATPTKGSALGQVVQIDSGGSGDGTFLADSYFTGGATSTNRTGSNGNPTSTSTSTAPASCRTSTSSKATVDAGSDGSYAGVERDFAVTADHRAGASPPTTEMTARHPTPWPGWCPRIRPRRSPRWSSSAHHEPWIRATQRRALIAAGR